MENTVKTQNSIIKENPGVLVRIGQNVLYSLIILICFYIIVLLYINLLIKEEDKSFKNITLQIKRFLGTVAAQVFFLGVSVIFGLLSSLPLVYFARTGGRIFALVITAIILLLLTFFYLRRVVRAYLKEKKFSVAFSALFPAWFKFIFWFLFTLYFLPFAIRMVRINLIVGILVLILAVFLVNGLFYMDRLVDFFTKKRRTAH